MPADPAPNPLDRCLKHLDELSEALSQWLGASVTLTSSEPSPLATAGPSPFADGRWFAIAMGDESSGLLAAASESLLPPVTFADGEEQSGGLTEAVSGLARLFHPEAARAGALRAAPVADLSEAIRRAAPSDAAQLAALSVKCGDDKEGTLLLVGPVRNALAAVADEGNEPLSAAERSDESGDERVANPEDLPPAVRALLKVAVPVSVTLAEKKMPLGQILDLGPGMIVQFEKSCDDLIDLNVNWHKIGRGEAMKVGEEFGLKITEIFSPAERAAILARTSKPKQGRGVRG